MRGATTPLVLVLAAACTATDVPPEGVLLNGLFDEWSVAATIVDDAADAPDAAVDVLSIKGLDEPGWLYLSLDVGDEVTLQSLPGNLHLLLDTDGAEATGGTAYGMPGVDLIVDFSQTAEARVEGRGLGFALRAASSEGRFVAIPRHSLGLTVLPTSSALRFEIRLSRRGASGSAPFGRRIRLSVVYVEDDRVIDETAVGSYAFGTTLGEPAPVQAAARLVKPSGSVRVVQWNVAWRTFPARLADFAGVLAALEPDIVLLDELPSDMSTADIASFFSLPAMARMGTWRFVRGETGGVQRALVAARGRDFRAVEALLNVRHPPGALEGLLATAPADLRPVLAREIEGGIPVSGAWVEVGGREILFVAVDLQSSGWLGSPRDRQRAVQATTIREHIGRARGGSAAPVFIGGDLNLVGSRTPLFTLVRGLDADGSDLVTIDSERLGERSVTTWRDPRDIFSPGRLDYMLLPDAALSVTNSFVFTTEDLDEGTLGRLGFDAGLSLELSDHMVSVADIRWTDDRNE